MQIVSKIKGKDDNQVALVFSCPGEKESKERRLVAGATGINLENLLKKLNSLNSNRFKYTNKNDYRITNASNIVHFKAKDNRTEPTCKEIRESKNLDRLYNDIAKYELIITFGQKACYAVKQIKHRLVNEEQIINILHHLGAQGLAHIKKDISGNSIIPAQGLRGNEKKKRGRENTDKRLEVVKSEIKQQIHVNED